MSYQPVIPAGGNLGWSFLKRTREAQQEAFETSSAIVRNTDYFREKIGEIRSAEELVADRRLLSVALGAFGLDDDIDNRFFIRKVLEEGTLDEESFANRLSDRRYFALSEAFGFHFSPPSTVISSFPDKIIEQYRTRQFEVAVGEQDDGMRLALGLAREMAALAERDLSEDAAWFTIMGTPPVREVFQTALGLPREFGAVDIDRQLAVLKEKAQARFGTSDPTDFADADLQEKLIRTYLFRSELAESAASTLRGSVALSLLQSRTALF